MNISFDRPMTIPFNARIVFLMLWLVVMPLHVAAIIMGNGNEAYTKPLLIPLLMLIYYLSTKHVSYRYSGLLYAALTFSWIGDIILIEKGETIYFLAGILTFLAAQMSYAFLFYVSSEKNIEGHSKWRIVGAVGIALFLATMIYILYPESDELGFAVLSYSIVVFVMLLSALFHKGYGQHYIITGALLFVSSDSILAYNKFVEPIPFGLVAVVVLYMLAQYYFVRGMIAAAYKSATVQIVAW